MLSSISLSAIKFINEESFEEIFIKDPLYNNIIFVPVLMNKFYYFTLTYYCISYSEDKKGFELISSSTLISFYLFLWRLITDGIQNYIETDTTLFVLQVIFSCIPILMIFLFFIVCIILLILKTIKCEDCQNYCCYIFILLFCFGGFWYDSNQHCRCYLFENCIGCNCYEDIMVCECCCCGENVCCHNEYCENNCYTCDNKCNIMKCKCLIS